MIVKDTEKIIDLLGYKDYLVSSKNHADHKLSTLKKHVLDEIVKFNIDNVYFSSDFPCIYFKSIKSFDENIINEILSIHRKIWNQRKVPFLYINSPSEIRIYNCYTPPLPPDKKDEHIKLIELYRYSVSDDEKALEELIAIFGMISIESGQFWKHTKYSKKLDTRKRVDKALVRNLQAARTKLISLGLELDIVHDLLIRSLFILYLEDREATNTTFYNNYLPEARSYFDILNDLNATYKLFSKLEDSFHGNLSPVSVTEKNSVTSEHLEVISDCFWGNEINSGQMILWKAFDFSVIPVELISEIYEEFLSVEQGEEEISKGGIYYTPHSLVEFVLNEQLRWADDNNKNYDLKVLDIACGSGIFLVESFRRLVDRWQFANKDKKISFSDLEKLLTESIFGIEKNQDAIKVAAFSLYLALLEYLDPKTIWVTAKFPYLINKPNPEDNEVNGNNLFLASSLGSGLFEQNKYDLIVGNPPFKSGQSGLLDDEINKYCLKHGFAQEMVLPFLHRASELCSDIGKISLVVTSKILFNRGRGYKKFRKFLFNENYIEAIYNFSALRRNKNDEGGDLFTSATGPVSIIFYQKNNPPNINENILYCVPKSSSRNKLVDGVIIDSSEIKYLPREECVKESTPIWKVGMWGNERDMRLIQKVNKNGSLKEALDNRKKSGWYKGGGLQLLTNDRDTQHIDREPFIEDMAFLDASDVQRYYTNKSDSKSFKDYVITDDYVKRFSTEDGILKFRTLGKKETYIAPHVLIKRGQSNKKFCASYLDYDGTFKHAVYGISSDNEHLLKALTAFFNSSFVSYFLFLTSGSWGVEREAVIPDEMLSIPAVLFFIAEKYIKELSEKVEQIINLKKENIIGIDDNYNDIEKEIDKLIYKALKLTKEEEYLVEDMINYTIDLFQEAETSIAYKNTDIHDMTLYTKVLCKNLNSLLEFSDGATWATIYEFDSNSPLNMVSIHFSKEKAKGSIEKIDSATKIQNLLTVLEKYSQEEYAESIYFRRIIKYYRNNNLYIIKPNEKRFWTRSMALNDADGIIAEVLNS